MSPTVIRPSRVPSGLGGMVTTLFSCMIFHAFSGNVVRHTFGLADFNILDLVLILHQLLALQPVVKHELCLPVHARPLPEHLILSGALQIGIADSRADGVRIRIPVPDYHSSFFFNSCSILSPSEFLQPRLPVAVWSMAVYGRQSMVLW